MSTPARPDPEAGARFLEKLMAEDPAHLDVATDEQVEAMMDAAGIETGEPESAEAALARGERRARERAARSMRKDAPEKAARRRGRSRVAWAAGALVATAAAAAGVALEIAGTPKSGPDVIGPDRPGAALTPKQQADRLREVAFAACAAQDWTTCRGKLDEAKALDPAGELDPRVVEARRSLAPPAVPDKPPATDKPPKPQ